MPVDPNLVVQKSKTNGAYACWRVDLPSPLPTLDHCRRTSPGLACLDLRGLALATFRSVNEVASDERKARIR